MTRWEYESIQARLSHLLEKRFFRSANWLEGYEDGIKAAKSLIHAEFKPKEDDKE